MQAIKLWSEVEHTLLRTGSMLLMTEMNSQMKNRLETSLSELGCAEPLLAPTAVSAMAGITGCWSAVANGCFAAVIVSSD